MADSTSVSRTVSGKSLGHECPGYGDRSRLGESSYGGIGLDSESQVTGGVVDLFFKTSTRSHEKSQEAVRLWRSLVFSRENTDGLRLL